jgi:hypothetical protein
MVIGGDWNVCPEDTRILDLISVFNLGVARSGQWTFAHERFEGGTSEIDFAITNLPQSAVQTRVRPDLCIDTDHTPVEVKIKWAAINMAPPPPLPKPVDEATFPWKLDVKSVTEKHKAEFRSKLETALSEAHSNALESRNGDPSLENLPTILDITRKIAEQTLPRKPPPSFQKKGKIKGAQKFDKKICCLRRAIARAKYAQQAGSYPLSGVKRISLATKILGIKKPKNTKEGWAVWEGEARQLIKDIKKKKKSFTETQRHKQRKANMKNSGASYLSALAKAAFSDGGTAPKLVSLERWSAGTRTISSDPAEVSSILGEHYKKVLTPPPVRLTPPYEVAPFKDIKWPQPAGVAALAYPPTREEFDKLIGSLKKKKTPSPEDEFSNELLWWGGEKLTELIFWGVESIFRSRDFPQQYKKATVILLHKEGKAVHDVKGWRPIALLSTLWKIVMKIIAARLLGFLGRSEGLSPQQAGGRPGRHTIDRLQAMLKTIEDSKHTKKALAVCYIDLQNAFGAVDRNLLYATMRKLGLPEDIVEFVEMMYSQASVNVVGAPGVQTGTLLLGNGLHQGCPASPLLFIISMEPILRLLDQSQDGYNF